MTVTPASVQSVSGGSTGSLQVTAPDGCNWSASATPNWITLGATGGTGSGNLLYTVAANTTPSARTGSITIANQTVPVAQAPTVCTQTLTPTSASVAAAAGNYMFHLDTNCGYIAVASSGWLQITAGVNGNAPADMGYSVSANTAPDARTGSIAIASQSFTVSQSGAGCSLSLSPTSADIDATGGRGTFNVTASANCRWQANANADWVHLTYAAVTFTVDANTQAAARTGQVSVAGQTFVLRHAGQTTQIANAGVLNSASFVSGPVAPGEIITIFGAGIGPKGGASLQLGSDHHTISKSLSGTQVLFDGNAAPLIYVSDTQVSAIAPYALNGQSTAQLQVVYQGSASTVVTLDVAATNPTVFSLDASGSGSGAILNQDSTLNYGR